LKKGLPPAQPALSRRSMPRLYDSKEIKEALKDLPAWEVEGKNIERTFEFEDFAQAIDFVNGVAELAEEAEHHPDIDIRYNKVRVILSTHSKGGLTDLDFDLAEKIDTLVDD
jgi:4a-hydroxytetrahydrobiopterin dehydratase